MSYLLPPAEVVAMFDAPPTPAAVLSPDRVWLLLVEYNASPSIALLARPLLRLGGVRVDPALGGRQRTVELTGLVLVRVADGATTRVAVPEGARLGQPLWSYDSRRFAFTVDEPDGIGVWVAEAGKAAA